MKRIYEDRVDCEVTRPPIGARADVVFALAAQCLARGHHLAECGVSKGETAKRLAEMIRAVGTPIKLHLFDVFDTCDLVAQNMMAAKAVQQTHAAPLATARELVGTDVTIWHAGLFSDTMREFDQPLGFVHADADLRESTIEIIDMASRCVVPYGIIVFDDFMTEWTGVADAVNKRLSNNWWLFSVAGSGQAIAVRK